MGKTVFDTINCLQHNFSLYLASFTPNFRVYKIGMWLPEFSGVEHSAGGRGVGTLKAYSSRQYQPYYTQERSMNAFTYILYSNSAQRFYTGSCDDLERRLHRHNESRVPSTKYGVPWKLVWVQKCIDRRKARKLELTIKKRGAKRFLDDQLSAT